MPTLSELEAKERQVKDASYKGWGCLPAIAVFFFFFAMIPGTGFHTYQPHGVDKSFGEILQFLFLSCAFPIIAPFVTYLCIPEIIKRVQLSNIQREIGTQRRLEELADQANRKLSDLREAIQRIAGELGISFPVDHLAQHTKDIQDVVDTYQTELLMDSTPLNELIARLTKKAERDKKGLEKANRLNQTALTIYTDTSRQVNRVGSIPLIKELEYDYAGLTSSELKSLLSRRKWDEYYDVVNSIVEDLQSLKDLAVKYELHEESEEEIPAMETDEERAYRIFGIAPTATDEQIKKLYKKLASVYHPDASVVSDDERFKEINWAYGVLKGAKNTS